MRIFLISFLFTICAFQSEAQTKQMNQCVVFYTPQINRNNTGNLFLNGLIKIYLVNNDTCLIQYTSHRLSKIKSIILLNEPSIISKIDSINSDIVSDSRKTEYKRLTISGKLNYLGKSKVFLMNANNKKIRRKIKTYSISYIEINADPYRITCGNSSPTFGFLWHKKYQRLIEE
jgi:hypothetical protein